MKTEVIELQGIKKEKTFMPMEVSRVYTSEFQKKGTLTAEIKQVVKTVTTYPGISVSNNLHDNVYSITDFKTENQKFEDSETRVTWILVPDTETLEQTKEKVAKASEAGARTYRILRNHPIITESQAYAIETGQTTKEAIAEKQVCRYPDSHAKAGQLILDNHGKPMYRFIGLKLTDPKDLDERTSKSDDYYATPEMVQEMEVAQSNSVIADQKL